jgi:hypothetical protein
MVNNNNNNLTSGTFTITNIPSNENLNFLLNGVITTTGQQSHDIDMMDTTRNSMDGTNQFKNEPFSPKNVYQVCCLD